jgi:hypothetical protein
VRCGGDLVSINSKAENDFVFELYSVDDRFMDVVVLWSGDTAVGGPMIGMSQDPAGREPTGGWRWSDGSPTTFTAWNDLSNSQDNEDVAMFWVDQLPGTPPDLTAIPRTWGDVGDHARSYVMEIQ